MGFKTVLNLKPDELKLSPFFNCCKVSKIFPEPSFIANTYLPPSLTNEQYSDQILLLFSQPWSKSKFFMTCGDYNARIGDASSLEWTTPIRPRLPLLSTDSCVNQRARILMEKGWGRFLFLLFETSKPAVGEK